MQYFSLLSVLFTIIQDKASLRVSLAVCTGGAVVLFALGAWFFETSEAV